LVMVVSTLSSWKGTQSRGVQNIGDGKRCIFKKVHKVKAHRA
jgi:hypothetical protein